MSVATLPCPCECSDAGADTEAARSLLTKIIDKHANYHLTDSPIDLLGRTNKIVGIINDLTNKKHFRSGVDLEAKLEHRQSIGDFVSVRGSFSIIYALKKLPFEVYDEYGVS